MRTKNVLQFVFVIVLLIAGCGPKGPPPPPPYEGDLDYCGYSAMVTSEDVRVVTIDPSEESVLITIIGDNTETAILDVTSGTLTYTGPNGSGFTTLDTGLVQVGTLAVGTYDAQKRIYFLPSICSQVDPPPSPL